MHGVKGISVSARHVIVQPILIGQQCDCTVRSVSFQVWIINLFQDALLGPKLAFTVQLSADATFSLALDKHHLRFYADN